MSSLSNLATGDGSQAVLLVTHHVEEIPVGFDRILMLEGGKVVAEGRLESTLTANTLSQTFGMSLKLERVDGRWRAWA